MLNIVRRISLSLIPRPDRPWEDDPTSNAPAKRKKRRLSSTERDHADEEEQLRKKVRGDTATPDAESSSASGTATETQAVKEVTQGVKEVELEDKKDGEADAAAPESIPLPEEQSGELDEPSSPESPAPPATVQSLADSNTPADEEPVPEERDLPESSTIVSPGESGTKKKKPVVDEENNAESESLSNDIPATTAETTQITPTEEGESED